MEKKDVRIVFLGTPQIAAEALEDLIANGFNIVGVVSQPDTVKGRKRVPTPSEVSTVALKHNIPLHRPVKLNKDYSFIEELHPDLLLTYAFGQILSTKVLALSSKYPPLNVHASALPLLRGASPIQTALLLGLDSTSVCLMEMVKEMDAGRVFARLDIPIAPEDDFTSLNAKVSKTAMQLLDEYLPLYFNNGLVGEPQDSNKATFCHMFEKRDEYLDFANTSGNELINKIRAFSLKPGAFFELENGVVLKAYKAQIAKEASVAPGFFSIASKHDILVGAKDCAVRLLTVQKEGKKMMDATSFISGAHDLNGMRVKFLSEVYPSVSSEEK